jgi:hypothetical protein
LKPSRAVHSSIAICALALATSCSVPQQVPNPQAAGNCKCARISPAARATGSSSASTVWGALIRNRICSHTAEVFSVRRRAAEARDGTIYKVGLDGKERVLHRFAGGSDGSHPIGGLTELGGTLYRTTTDGGGSGCQGYGGCGTIFSISPSGANYTVIHAFGGSDGAQPNSDMTVLDGAATTRGSATGRFSALPQTVRKKSSIAARTTAIAGGPTVA